MVKLRRSNTAILAALGATTIALSPTVALAGPCDITWDGEALAHNVQGREPQSEMHLLDTREKFVAKLTSEQILAISEAKEGITKQIGRSPSLIFCSDKAPNAFATSTPSGEVVGVTIGLVLLINGDRDMAAFVIGHEYAHLILGHVAAAEQRRGLLTLLGELAGAAIEYKTATKTRVQGVGMDLGLMGASLISYKFDRDQEREADVTGFRYMVDAGFNPLGAMRLAETMQRHGAGGIGLFYDNHPGWQERADLFQALIKANPMAQATIARTGSRTALTTASIGIHQPLVALVPAYQASAAEKALADGLAALDRHDFPAAVPAIQSSAAAGYAPAQNALGYLYSKGLAGLPKDEVAGVRLFRLAAAQSDMYGMNNLGAMYMFGRGGLPIDQAEALRLYRAAATQRNPVALNNLGEAYHFGATAGIDRDDSAARTYFQQAADAGNGDALAWLGWFFQTGSANLQKSMSTAITMYRRAADKGSALGQYRLALCYINGNCELPKDAVEGAKWLRLSADQDYAGAQYELGRLYYDGAGGLPKNEAKAAELYKLSADSGFGHSQAVLGAMYQRGEGGLPTNPAEGLRLINLAATQGDAGGELALAYLYEHGVGGVPKDMEAAAGWYRKAAAQGVASATDRLRELHAN